MVSWFDPFILPYTRAELPFSHRLIQWAGNHGSGSQAAPVTLVRGTLHGYLMKLDRSNWAQRITYYLGRYYELGVQKCLDALLRPGDRFVDIGANIGMITLHARSRVGAAGQVDCFEPNPDCVAAIREHLEINQLTNVVIHPCALAETPGSLVLSLTSEHSGTATLADVGDAAVRSIRVDVRVGDEVIAGAPRAIKIDVEGFELHVLKGLQRTLSTHKPFVIIELIESQLARAGTSVAEVSGFLFGLGYEAYGISSARRLLRKQLTLHPLARGGAFESYSDVLWAHPSQSLDVRPYLAKRAH
ncbi:MAG: hypothetical protein JWP52_3907 [Rhizobacter sp.]|nr:hypothetical protein [Rhizobacter sp.]